MINDTITPCRPPWPPRGLASCPFSSALLGAALGVVALAGVNEPCRVGVQLHLVSTGRPDESYMRQVRTFVEGGMLDFALLVAQGLTDVEREQVARYLAEHRVHFLLQEAFPTSPAWFESPGPARAGQPPHARYARADYERLRALAGECFLGVHWGELDSSGMKPEDYLPSEILARPTRRQVKEALLGRIRGGLDLFRERSRAPFAHSSAVLSHALFAEAGADLVCSEIGENVPNFNLMLASNRGAARAYGRRWMIDHSTWWAPRGHAGEQVSPREGHTPWCLFTSLLGAAVGGADYVQLEVDWAAYDKSWNLLPWGRAMKSLCALARQIGARGEAITPFAILLGHESGWPGVGWRVGDVRGTGLFDGLRHRFMQTRDADLSLKLLEVFYPGFERSGWDPEYPGFLAESPMGVCDVVPDNLPPEKYARYSVLVALGYHRMTDAMLDSLRGYVEQGGVLVCGDNLFLDDQEQPVRMARADALLGCTVDLSEAALVHLSQPSGALEAAEPGAAPARSVEWQEHWLHPVRLGTARVVARLDDAPLVLENRVGAGRVCFVTALNLVGSGATRRGPEPFLFSNTLARFLRALHDQLGDGIAFSPWTSLERVYTERADGTALLLVMNHGDMTCRRDASLRNGRGFTAGRVLAQGGWSGWDAGGGIAFTGTGATLKWSFDAPPKGFVLFEFRR